MATNTQWQSQSQTDAENELGVSPERYEELAPTLSRFLQEHEGLNAKLIFAYSPKGHKWHAIMAHKDDGDEKVNREFNYEVSPDVLMVGLKEMSAQLAGSAIKRILFSEPEEVEEEPADDWENW